MKKVIRLLIVITFVILACGLQNVTATERGLCGTNISWELNNEGVLTLSGTGAIPDYTITYSDEEEATDYWNWISLNNDCETILPPWFACRSDIKKIVINEGITCIGKESFSYCRNLLNVSLPSSLDTIGPWAFAHCDNLDSIIIPSEVSALNEGVFVGCEKIKKINLPSKLSVIADNLFSGCSSLKEVGIPSGIRSIGNEAFLDCENLHDIVLLEGVNSIGYRAFEFCNFLSDVPWSFAVPSTVSTIGYRAFSYCRIDKLYIGKGIKQINEECFFQSIINELYYNGSKEEWDKIAASESEYLKNTIIHYALDNSRNDDNSSGDRSGGSTPADIGTEENSSNKGNNTNRGNELIFSRDVWGFDNFEHYDGCKIEGGAYKNPYIDKLDSASREAVLKYLKKGASSGHCFGMSAIVILNKIGRENIKHWGDVDCIRDFSESGVPLWMICYYNAMQKVLDFYYEVQNFSRKSRTEQVRILAEKVDKVKSGGTPVLLVYKIKGGGAHAVVAYALESGNFKSPTTGREFNRRVLLYDCNAIDWSEKTCLLFRAGTGEWEIPRYGTEGGSSFDGAELLCATNDTKVFDWKADIIEASLAETIENGTNYLDFSVVTFISNTNVILKRIGTNDQWEIDRNAEIVSGTSNIVSYSDIGSESNQNCGVNVILPSANGSYSFIPASGNPGKIDLGVLSSNHYVAVESDTAKELDFTIGESTILRGNKDDFQVTITSNNLVNEGQFETVSVTGNAEGDISISVDNGLISVEGDNIEGLTVKATDGEESTSTIIENSGKAVFSNFKKDSLSAITSRDENPSSSNESQVDENTHTSSGGQIGWTVQPNSESQTDENTQPAGEKQVDEVTQPATEAQPVTPETVQESITISRTPSSVKIKVKKNKVTVSWKKIKKKLLSKIKNIQIQYSTDPLFVQNTVTKVVGKKKTEAVLKLKKKTTYYIRLRYVGKDGFSNWSKVKKIKTK